MLNKYHDSVILRLEQILKFSLLMITIYNIQANL